MSWRQETQFWHYKGSSSVVIFENTGELCGTICNSNDWHAVVTHLRKSAFEFSPQWFFFAMSGFLSCQLWKHVVCALRFSSETLYTANYDQIFIYIKFKGTRIKRQCAISSVEPLSGHIFWTINQNALRRGLQRQNYTQMCHKCITLYMNSVFMTVIIELKHSFN